MLQCHDKNRPPAVLFHFYHLHNLSITMPLLVSYSIQLSNSIGWYCSSGHTAYTSLACFKFLSLLYPIGSDSVHRENGVQEDEIVYEATII